MKKTALSTKELNILENVITSYGYVVSFDDLATLLKGYSHDALKQQISSLSSRGWLIRIKRGFYAVANLESHNFSNISPLIISRVLVSDSYVSFEFAMNYHGFFDQLPKTVSAVTTTRTKTFHFQGLDYRYAKAKPGIMMGFEEITIEGQSGRVAELEKALLDFLHFRRDSYTVDLLLEKLKEAKNEIDVSKLTDFSKAYPITLKRRLGFLLDFAGIDSRKLYQELKGTPGFAKLTKNSNIFNAKWRLYYEDRFNQ